jgi:glutathione peroxidase-family protein
MRITISLILCIAALLFLANIDSGPLEFVAKDIYGNPFSLSEYRGRVVVLFFTNKKYVKQRSPEYSDLYTSYALNEKLQPVVIFSSKGVPKIGRRTFRKKLISRIRKREQEFREQVRQDGKDPAKIVFPRYLTDWKSFIHRMFDMDPKEENFSIVILDPRGNLVGRFPGEERYDEAIQRLETLLKLEKRAKPEK